MPSPYGGFRASTTPEDMARLARSLSPAQPAADLAAAGAAAPAPVAPMGASPAGAAAQNPYLSEPTGFQYRPVGADVADGLAGGALPKYHFSLSWSTRKATEAGASHVAPSGPQQIDDVLYRLSVDRSGLRCAPVMHLARARARRQTDLACLLPTSWQTVLLVLVPN